VSRDRELERVLQNAAVEAKETNNSKKVLTTIR
jgi:hypothetical protein